MLSDLLPNLGQLIDLIINWTTPLMNALIPFAGYLIGIPVAFIILTGIYDAISEKLFWNEEKVEDGV